MADLTTIPSLDEISREPLRLEGLDAATLVALELRVNAMAGSIAARLALAISGMSKTRVRGMDTPEVEDAMLTPAEAATLLRKKPRWIYRNAAKLPFVKRVSPRSLLCSKRGIERWLEKRKA